MEKHIKDQEKRILSIIFNSGEIPKQLNNIIDDLMTSSTSKNIIKAINSIKVDNKFNYKNVGFLLSEKTNNEKWIDLCNEIYDLNVNKNELEELINSFKNIITKNRLENYKKNITNIIDQNNFDNISDLEKEFKKISLFNENKKTQDFNTISENAIEQITNDYNSDSDTKGIKTGITKFDDNIGGLHDTDLLIVAARPGIGKTSFLISIMKNIMLNKNNNKKILFFSAEMPSVQLAYRLMAMIAKVNTKKLRNPKLLTKEELLRLKEAYEICKNFEIYVNDTASITIEEIKSVSHEYKKDNNISLILVDYLQRLKYGSATAQMSKSEKIGEIAKGLKENAKELSVPIVALAQLNRKVDGTGTPPVLSDLKDSGDIEQEADVICFLYKPYETIDDINEEHNIHFIIGKNRHGPLGFFELKWIPQYTLFEDSNSSEDINDSPY